ncbi:MAG: XRE family transcriptional regulator [Smithellaceae bacterium]|nr:XRE family transcriptional regulator [Smithellaceae bacterium]
MENKLNIKKIEQKVQELGLNQTALAQKMQVSKEAVSKWLRNEKYPRPDKLLKLARLLNLSFSEMVCKKPAPNEPVIAFRKKGAHKITPDYIDQAKDMGMMLKELVPYLPFDDLSQPAILKTPSLDYDYIRKVADRVRKTIGVREGEEIRFDHLIRFFNELQAVIIPVLWGNKENHENALHIYLPESMTTWIYLNLDCKVHDFKFWMAHELGHVHAPTLQGEAGEDFADAFAGALLVPHEMAASAYEALQNYDNVWSQINHIKLLAEKLVVSPLTVYYQINKYADYSGKPKIDLESSKAIYQATTNFNKQFQQVSEGLFGTKSPSPSRYIASAKEQFGSPFFDILGKYLTKHHKSPSFIQSILNIPLLDAQNVYKELC